MNKNKHNYSSRELKRLQPLVKSVLSYYDSMKNLSDEDLRSMTDTFKSKLNSGESTMDMLLPEAFAVVSEAAYRVLGMRPYPVQILGGIVLYQGRIAEMKTGEGKTLVAAMPSYLMALSGKGVHVVTVNDYLARRDADEIGKIYEFLGLRVGCVLNDMSTKKRQEMYNCDITYITSNELGFDYLRDNMAVSKETCVQRDLNYVIIDEVDSVLIDEARTPLIISGMAGEADKFFGLCNYMAGKLERGYSGGELTKAEMLSGVRQIETGDFIIDEKEKQIHLTESGISKIEKFFNLKNYADPENLEIQHNMINALRAHHIMHKDKDYVVKNGEVIIVDEFTGRMMPGRRYNDGLHQALEAKEGVTVHGESATMATITLQNFFNKYKMKAGMTGTAYTEQQEFKDIYGMDVVVIPTNMPMIRKDLPDKVYLTKKEKYQAVVDEVDLLYQKGQPVLVGTVSIAVSELLSSMLKKRDIPHTVLNAKLHEKEAEIVSHAGEAYHVTIATNMAGRGTDIKLTEESVEKGGLFIIGTERHESRRIDNQLRGRSGRQGDPGTSQFYISLEDDVMRLFASPKMLKVFESLGMGDGRAVDHKSLTKTVRNAQKKIEGNNFAIRKHLVDYDAVNNLQRDLIYANRQRVLNQEDVHEIILDAISELSRMLVQEYCPGHRCKNYDLDGLKAKLSELTGREVGLDVILKGSKKQMIKAIDMDLNFFYKKVTDAYSDESLSETENIAYKERNALLRGIDRYWVRHIGDLDQLRQSISLIGYGQKDPVVEYKLSAFDIFDKMQFQVNYFVIGLLLRTALPAGAN